MKDLSLTSLGFSILSIVIVGILLYLYNKREKIKLDKIIEESNATIKESELIRKESKKLLEELEIEKERNFKLKAELQLEKDNLANKPCKPKPISKPRVSKYNKPNILYIAYDFNILNNESYLDIRKKIINLKDNTKLDAIRTTSVIFLNSIYLDIFTDIILVKKSGVSISLRTLLVDNPSYYIENKNLLKKPTFDTVLILGGATGILQQIDNGNIKFKREK